MISRSKIGLNRILIPDANLEEFYKLSSDMGLHKIELRNDLPGKGIIDACSPNQVKELSDKYEISIVTINALQKFNLGAVLPDALEELKGLIDLAASIDCKAVVLVPNNDTDDIRDSEVIMQETVAALKAYGPLFDDSGVLGYVEPLGFEQCSLRSKVTAMHAIQESGCNNYKIVHDTFHHHLGPDTADTLDNDYDIAYSGLVHLSGVESDIPFDEYKDEHRIFITEKDNLENLAQIEQLTKLGYKGDFSFEPFAGEIQTMEIETLKATINQSIDFITSG
jgi:2-keto-myo-inositol isomerase